jgi:hypothetical protein
MKNVKDEPILKFLVDYMWGQMSVQSSPFFLPKILSTQQHSYDPYDVGEWNLGTLPQNNDAVCIRGNTPGHCIGNPSLVLSSVVITGLYNLQPGSDQPAVNDTNVQGTLNFCTLPMGTPYVTSQYITINGRYLYTQYCQDDSAKKKSGNNNDYYVNGTGSFTCQIFQAAGSVNMDITASEDGKSLVVTVHTMEFDAPLTIPGSLCTAPGANNNSNICISIQMDNSSDYNFLANQAANYQTVTQDILDNINKKLKDPKALQDLSTMLTTQINNIFHGMTKE